MPEKFHVPDWWGDNPKARWCVVRRANTSNGNTVCEHRTRSEARKCAKNRNRGGSDGCLSSARVLR